MPNTTIAVVTDSISCLTKELTEQYNINIIPINFYACGNLYRDWVDITPTEAYKLFLRDPDSFKTSAASPEECLEVFRDISQWADTIICVTVSSALSMMNEAARDAARQAQEQIPGIHIEVIDSQTATSSEGMIALAAARAAAEGKDLPDVLRIIEETQNKVRAVLFLDTLRHVYRSGRIPRIASRIGSALNIKPLLSVSRTVHFLGMARTEKQGMERIIKMMREVAADGPLHVSIMHAYAEESAQRLRELIEAEFDPVDLWMTEFSPVMGYACGTGTVGAAFYTD